jgi:ligand-binding SRPBCC domain-containing protein
MRERVFRATMRISRPRDEVFRFFADAENLERITPPELRFRITSAPQQPIVAGALIHYRLRLMGVPFSWTTLIPSWSPPDEFVDEQIRGPYRKWVHTHRFAEDDAGTVISDEVRYQLPFWPVGELAAPLVALQIRRIFAFRQAAIARLLG